MRIQTLRNPSRSGAFAVLLALAVASPLLRAEIRLNPLFSNGAVLQQGKPVPVWGTATPGERLKVAFADQIKVAVADASGAWKVTLDPLKASSEPGVLRVVGSETVLVKNVLVGEVWLCSGQSNMHFNLAGAENAAQEIAGANFPTIRQFAVQEAISPGPTGELVGGWDVCTPATAPRFTAVGYFFAREIQKNLGVPVGLIKSSVGGTPIEAWIGEEGCKATPHHDAVLKRWDAVDKPKDPKVLGDYEAALAAYRRQADEARVSGKPFPAKPPGAPEGVHLMRMPGGLFNGMIHPLFPHALQGILWYQGEANAPRYAEYPDLLREMIAEWRRGFAQGDVPFYLVQLPNFNRVPGGNPVEWAPMREAQASVLTLPNTGMAVTFDLGEPENIHPKNKKDVGGRLARVAMAKTYGGKEEYSGPVLDKAVREGEGVRLSFSHADGMVLKDISPNGFEVSGDGAAFQAAQARVEGNAVIVSAEAVKAPAAVRYAWHSMPPSSLYNAAGLPAPPFQVTIK